MRLAVMADIHGNALALQAVLDDMRRTGGCDVLVNLGDCVSGPLWPAETLAALMSLGCLTVRGNHDRRVGALPQSALSGSDLFAWQALDAAQGRWLAALPFEASVVPGVMAVHASPRSDEEYLIETIRDGQLERDRPARIVERLGAASARIVLCGHSHRPDLVALDDRLIVNPGSVGCPAYIDSEDPPHVSESGSPLARYATLDLDDAVPALPRVRFHAVPYDHERAARRSEESGRPDWAAALRSGCVLHPPES